MRPQPRSFAGEIIEGEYVALPLDMPGERRVAAPAAMHRPRPAGMEALRSQETAPPPAFSSRGGAIFWLFGIILITAAFWIAGGHALVSR